MSAAPIPPTVVLDRPARRRHLALALIAIAPFLLGPAMEADLDHAALFGWSAPPCPSTAIPGIGSCPGCGLTRGVVLLLHGDLAQSYAAHPAAALLLVLAAGAFAVHGDIWRRGRMAALHRLASSWGRRLLAVTLGIVWLSRIAGG